MFFSYSRSKATALSLCLTAGLWTTATVEAGAPLKLHVPSPDWRDQIIYFLMTDRFEDGNPRNNDQGEGEFNPQKSSHFSGGDLAGVKKRLDYIQGLGATSVWVTPPVLNQWWNGTYGGYHGYWAADFKRMDPHFGTLKEYQQLSDALHRRGMYLVQDIVLNHTGDFFKYQNWRADDPAHGFELNPQSTPMKVPRQAPFNMNDPRNPAHRKAGIYHWTPDVVDYSNPQQELNFQMAGLDDLNSENPRVRRALRDSYAHWIRNVGVDAFRLDTAFYVPTEAIQDFLYAKDSQHPGMQRVAQQTGRKDFFMFGEGFAIGKPGDTQAMSKIEAYVRDAQGKPVMQGMLNFTLYGSIGDVMARGRPTAVLADRIRQTMRVHSDPHRMPTFLDNHDVDRFLKGGNELGLRQGLALIMTLPGIPTIYYGTEQGFQAQRAAMFATGHGSEGRDHFNTQSPLYTFTKSIAQLRQKNRVFSRGTPTILREDGAGAGVLAYRMDHEGQSAWVIFNTAEHEVLLDNLALLQGFNPTGKDTPPNRHKSLRLKGVWGVEGAQLKLPADVQFKSTEGSQAMLNLRLAPRSTQIWLSDRASEREQVASVPLVLKAPVWPTEMPDKVSGDFSVTGVVSGLSHFSSSAKTDVEWLWVTNGDLKNAQSIQTSDTQWRVDVDTSRWADLSTHRVLLMVRDKRTQEVLALSEPKLIRLEKKWERRAQVTDGLGDDRGPLGTYLAPKDPTYIPGVFDIESVEAWTAGKSLRVKVKMGAISRVWSPANGFDHQVLTMFIGKPNPAQSLQVMPLQQDALPTSMHWHYRLRAHGWSNVLFTTQGASAKSEGVALAEAANIQVNVQERTLQFDFPANLLADLPSLNGLKIWVNTWDYDSGYRKLSITGGTSEMGGGQPDQPLWMDSVGLEIKP
jgi:glycosidase